MRSTLFRMGCYSHFLLTISVFASDSVLTDALKAKVIQSVKPRSIRTSGKTRIDDNQINEVFKALQPYVSIKDLQITFADIFPTIDDELLFHISDGAKTIGAESGHATGFLGLLSNSALREITVYDRSGQPFGKVLAKQKFWFLHRDGQIINVRLEGYPVFYQNVLYVQKLRAKPQESIVQLRDTYVKWRDLKLRLALDSGEKRVAEEKELESKAQPMTLRSY